jgi:hypothetical protein
MFNKKLTTKDIYYTGLYPVYLCVCKEIIIDMIDIQ